MKILKQTLKKFLHIIIFLTFSAILLFVWWSIAGNSYVFSDKPTGGDYFNALTYVNFFYHYFPLPPLGWLPFWNEGSPVIGGYPWFAFYLMKPLMEFFDPANTMEIFANLSLALFFIASLLLFRQVSKNWFIASALTLILIATRATYYPLMTGGFLISATAQWYLPLVLLFLYKYAESAKKPYLILAAIFGGFSILHHAPTSILMILAPATALFLGLPVKQKKLKAKILDVLIFIVLSCTIGATGIYTVVLQTFMGSGTDLCQSPQCWGIYPKHLIVWMNYLTPLVIIVSLLVAIITKLLKRSTNILSFLPAFSALIVLFFYALFAYLHLINGAANVIFPTRIFWAANLFLLLIAAHLFQSLGKALPKVFLLISIALTAAIGYIIYLHPPIIHKDFMATIPMDSYKYTIPKYKTNKLSELVPNWVPLNETNWRLDTFNSGLTHWWNFVSHMPSVRGYSDHPVGKHRDWQYFLQTATRDPQGENQELIKNRALFLLDAFGIGYRENSIASYPQSIITDPHIITNTDTRRDFTWFQFSPNMVSPIVSPTNSNAVMFIGDEKGYESFIRTIAMTNLNSFVMIPIKGKESIDDTNSEELKHFKSLVLYRFKGDNWSQITSYVNNGGMVFIETGTDNQSRGKLQEIFPIKTVNTTTINGPLDATLHPEFDAENTIKLQKFSPFIFEGGSWKVSSASLSNIRSWAKPILSQENQVLLARGTLGKGEVAWSGMNLLFHIVQNDNYEEAKLFANIMAPAAKRQNVKPEYKVTRDDPRIIKITGTNINGVYFKENYDSGWTAKENGQKLKIYKAGLDFMYISIPQARQNQNITLSYNGSLTNWLVFLMSVFSLILAILYTIIPHPFHSINKHAHHHVKHKIGKRLTAWWQREEE
jgi:hypothetical protein